MCGRFTIGEIKELIPRFSIEEPIRDMPRPRYNVAPTQEVPIVIRRSPNQLVMMRFGLVPFWAKDEKIGSRLINARAENLTQRPAFRNLLKGHRCLVPTTGFYEWKATPGGKEPYLVKKRSEKLFAMAGLYDHWKDPSTGNDLMSFTIITTQPNELMAPIHNRMPVVLAREDEDEWVRPEPLEGGELERICRPYSSEEMEAYPVSRAVNDATKDSPDLIKPAMKVGAAQGEKWF